MIAIALLGCNDRVGAIDLPPPYVEHCGEEGPVQILALEPNEITRFRQLHEHEGRYLTGIKEFAAPVVDVFEAEVGTTDDVLVAQRIVSFDRCGADDPFVVADGYDEVIAPSEPGQPWLACNDITHELAVFDPIGIEDPIPIGTLEGCYQYHFEGTSLFVKQNPSEKFGPSEIHRFDFDGEGPPIETVYPGPIEQSWVGVMGGDEVVACGVTPEHELVQIELETGTTTVLFDGVAHQQWHQDGRYVAWSSVADESRWMLWDRETGENTPLGDSDWDRAYSFKRSDGFVTTQDSEQASEIVATEIRLIDRIDEAVILPGWWELYGMTEEGVAVVGSSTGNGGGPGFFALDPGSNTPRLLVDRYSYPSGWLESDTLLFFEHQGYQTDYPPIEDYRTRLVRVPVDGSGAETISGDVYQPLIFTLEQLVTVRNHVGDYHGDLVLTTPKADYALDTDAFLFSTRYNMRPHTTGGGRGPVRYSANHFVYAVRDANHERTGLWTLALEL